MANVGSMTNVRQMEAEQFAREMACCHMKSTKVHMTNAVEHKARAKNRQTERYAKQFGAR